MRTCIPLHDAQQLTFLTLHAPGRHLYTQFTGAVFSASSMDEASVSGEGGVRNSADGSRQNVPSAANHAGRAAMAPPTPNEGGAAVENPEVDDVSMTDAMARDISEVADMFDGDAWTFVPRGRHALRRGGPSLMVLPRGADNPGSECDSDSMSELSFSEQSGTLCTEITRASSHIYGFEVSSQCHDHRAEEKQGGARHARKRRCRSSLALAIVLATAALLALSLATVAVASLKHSLDSHITGDEPNGSGIFAGSMAICGISTATFALKLRELVRWPPLQRTHAWPSSGHLALVVIVACAAAVACAVTSAIGDHAEAAYDVCTSETIFGVSKSGQTPFVWSDRKGTPSAPPRALRAASGEGQLPNLPPTEITDIQTTVRTGTIPTEYGLLSNLEILKVSGQLKGTIPTELGNLEMQHVFDLRDNSFSSAIPTELGRLDKMRFTFDLRGNSLSSSIPSQLGNLVKLSSSFMLNGNWLSSTIPSQLGRMEDLAQQWALQSNFLSSSIPTQVSFGWKLRTRVYTTRAQTRRRPTRHATTTLARTAEQDRGRVSFRWQRARVHNPHRTWQLRQAGDIVRARPQRFLWGSAH